jgi:lipoprotein-anchoring transpeptidase ErfK/SrfK
VARDSRFDCAKCPNSAPTLPSVETNLRSICSSFVVPQMSNCRQAYGTVIRMQMRNPTGTRATAVLGALAVLAALVMAPRGLADPDVDVFPPADPSPAETVEQMAAPSGIVPFSLASVNPSNESTVGVAKPIIINFVAPVTDRLAAEDAIHISSDPQVPGKFYWMNDSQVRWRPLDFWPAHTTVTIDAAGAKSSFTTGDALVATADGATHQMTITRNGNVEQTFPMSMGKPGHDTPDGTYYVQDKFYDVVMDSETYGVDNESADGYRLHVKLAVQIDNSGNYVHSAPWSVADQGMRNVSHGCINISPDNAKWFFDNFGIGDPIVVTNSVGSYSQNDGGQDWQI